MKKLNQISKFILTIALFGCISSCNKKDDSNNNTNNNNTGLRDTHIIFGVTGDYSQSEDIIFQKTHTNATSNYTAMFSPTGSTLSIAIYANNASWAFGIGTSMSSVSSGSFTIPASGSYANTTTGAVGFVVKSGTLNITSVESTSPYGNAGDRYISGNFNIQYENSANPVQTITNQGTFTNIYVVEGT